MSLENCTGYPEMPKDSSECVKLLRQFNEWRRFDGEIDEEGPAMPHPKSIGFAIDMAIRLIEELADMTEQVECSTIVKENMEGRLNILLVKHAAMKEQRDELLVALDMYERALEGLFIHCLSNGVFNARHQPLDCMALNNAHSAALAAIASAKGSA